MNGTESVLNLLDGFEFVSSKDRENTLHAQLWLNEILLDPATKPFPLVIITGPPGCGKSTLLYRMKVHLTHRPCFDSSSIDDLSFAAAAQLSAALVVFDEPRSLTAERIERLREFTSKNSWEYRPLGTEKLITRGKCCLVVVTGRPKELKGLLSYPGIEDWSIQIRMKARDEQKGGQ